MSRASVLVGDHISQVGQHGVQLERCIGVLDKVDDQEWRGVVRLHVLWTRRGNHGEAKRGEADVRMSLSEVR